MLRAMNVPWFCLTVCGLVACGLVACGPSEEPKSAASVDDFGDTTDGLDGSSSSADGSDGEKKKAAPSEGSASAEDIATVLQLVIDDEALGAALRLEEPGRFPLQIAGNGIPDDVAVTRSSEPVKVVDLPSDEKAPVLIFTEFEVTSLRASATMKYPPERLRARATLEKGDDGWELVNSSQSQY